MARPAASRKWPEQHRPSVAGSKAYSTPALEEPLAASAALAVYTLVVLAAAHRYIVQSFSVNGPLSLRRLRCLQSLVIFGGLFTKRTLDARLRGLPSGC